jgi:hypothetical protein
MNQEGQRYIQDALKAIDGIVGPDVLANQDIRVVYISIESKWSNALIFTLLDEAGVVYDPRQNVVVGSGVPVLDLMTDETKKVKENCPDFKFFTFIDRAAPLPKPPQLAAPDQSL